MDEQAAAVDVAQKVVAQSGAVGGALNDAGDVRHDEGDALLHIHHAQVGEKGGEVIIGDLGLSPADHAEQRGLTHVGEAHQPHIGQQLQLQHHLAALAGIASLGKAGDLPGGGGEVLVAPAAPAAPAEDEGGVIRHIWMISWVAASRMMVPRGTRRTRSAPFLPVQRLPPPSVPLAAVYLRL